MESPEINPYICNCFSGEFIGNEICVSVCLCVQGMFVGGF